MSTKLLTLFGGKSPWPRYSDLSALYLMDAGSGTALLDSGPQKIHGTFGATTAAPSWATEGLAMDGGDNVIVANNVRLNGAAPLTLMLCWMQTSVAAEVWPWDARDSNVGHTVRVNVTTGQIYLYADTMTPRFTDGVGEYVAVTPNAWNLAVIRHAGGTATPTLWLNGGGPYNGSGTCAISAFSGTTYIGSRRTVAYGVNGLYGLAASWRVVLTDSELTMAVREARRVMAAKGVGPDELVILE